MKPHWVWAKPSPSGDLPEAAEFAKQIRSRPTDYPQSNAAARVASLALRHPPSWATPISSGEAR
ncbi:MAG: hypothetical protein R3Y56_07150 [Akkermansia sp.]